MPQPRRISLKFQKKRVTVHFHICTIRQCDIFPLLMNMVWIWFIMMVLRMFDCLCVTKNDNFFELCQGKVWDLLHPSALEIAVGHACVCHENENYLSLSLCTLSCCVYESQKMSIFSRRSFGASTGVSVCDVISSLLKVTPQYECLRWGYDEVSVCLWRLRITDKGNQPQIEF